MKKVNPSFALLASLCALASSGCTQTANSNGNLNAANTAVVSGDNSNSVSAPPVNAAPPAPVAAPGTPTAAPGGGVNNVPNPTNASNTSANANARPAKPLTPAPTPQIASGANDFYLFTQARAALDADAELNKANLVLDVREGAVTLTGTVANDAQSKRAAQLVRAVSGIKSVKNQLRVGAQKQ